MNVFVELNSLLESGTHTDYPKKAIENAKQVKEWKDKYGDEVTAMTPTGWARTNQLSKGEAISTETVQRMANFIRHKKNSKISPEYKDTPWKDNGYVSWLGWGGTEGIQWAIDKIKQIKKDAE